MDTYATAYQEPSGQRRKVHTLSWSDCDDLTAILVQKIQVGTIPDIIVGLQRGGLIPAVMLSHSLGIETFLSFPVRRTTTDAVYAAKHAPVALPSDLCAQLVAGKKLLIVDDVVGSGATLREILRLLASYAPAQVQSLTYIVNREHWNSANRSEPADTLTYIGKELSGWVVFPWEKCGDAQSLIDTSLVAQGTR